MKNILLTGSPGVGKTTLIQKIVRDYDGKAGGFYTQEITKNQRRTGFEIVTFSGVRGVLSSVYLKSPFHVGRYRVNLKDLEEIGVREMEKALEKDDLIVVDEIGKMELFSSKFQTAITRILASPKIFLGTIMKGKNSFADKIKERSDVFLVEVTEENRNSLIFEILKQVG